MSDSPVAMVTGASTGIGLAIVKQLLDSGYRVAATARRESLARFGELSHPQLKFFALDVTHAQQRAGSVHDVLQAFGRIDVLVNNAGICTRSVLEHLSFDDEHRQFDVNYFGAMALTRLVLPQMRQRRSGHIVNISSTAGMVAMPTMGCYSASKFAFEGASEALWYEMKPWGIHVTLIQPGFVHSQSFRNAMFTEKAAQSLNDENDDYHIYYTEMLHFIERLMIRSPSRPEDIARIVVRELRRPGRLRVHATWDARLFNLLRRGLPQRVYHWVLYRGLPRVKHWVKP
ncbi:MAG: SDR family oxidoreductase [Acidobacteria bacterium]|nr:SDR family oxidoreductase [Acidobacteriota bacterium]